MSRAMVLRSVATESSRSRIRPSGPLDGPLASLRSESAGTNRKERIGLSFGADSVQKLLLTLFRTASVPLTHDSAHSYARMSERDARGPEERDWPSRLRPLAHQRLALALRDDLSAL